MPERAWEFDSPLSHLRGPPSLIAVLELIRDLNPEPAGEAQPDRFAGHQAGGALLRRHLAERPRPGLIAEGEIQIEERCPLIGPPTLAPE